MMVFGQDGDIQIGCGIMDMDTEVLILGDMATTTTGPDHSHSTEECTIHSTLFGDIMTHSFSDTDMVMLTDILMDIIHGGDPTTHGIIIILTEDLIPMYHLLVEEEILGI